MGYAGSDIDVLVTFEGHADFDRFMDLKFFLEEQLGAAVDLVTPNARRPDRMGSRVEQVGFTWERGKVRQP